MQRFGEKLRELRRRRGLTMQELAAALGFSSHAHVGRIETGEKTPSAELAVRIADYFNVSLDRLMRDGCELLPEDGRPAAGGAVQQPGA